MRQAITGWAMAAALAALPAAGQTDKQPYTLAPALTAAGKAFPLKTFSSRFNCSSKYSHQSVAVAADQRRIDVRFLDSTRNDVICPLDMLYGPEFDLPALKAGVYAVYATRLVPCQVQQPMCEIPEKPEFAGNLTVTGDGNPRDGWSIQPGQVKAGVRFDMQLLNGKYGNCQTTFSMVSAAPYKLGFLISFLPKTDPGIICIIDIRPWGPTAAMEALKAGGYPIYVHEIQACEQDKPPCPGSPLPSDPEDTLIVDGSTGLAGPDARGAAAQGAGAQASPRLAFAGNFLRVFRPAAGGHELELLTLSGRRLQSFHVPGGETVSLAVDPRWRRGLYLVRLGGADRDGQIVKLFKE